MQYWSLRSSLVKLSFLSPTWTHRQLYSEALSSTGCWSGINRYVLIDLGRLGHKQWLSFIRTQVLTGPSTVLSLYKARKLPKILMSRRSLQSAGMNDLRMCNPLIKFWTNKSPSIEPSVWELALPAISDHCLSVAALITTTTTFRPWRSLNPQHLGN